jgi:hypothetical protein
MTATTPRQSSKASFDAAPRSLTLSRLRRTGRPRWWAELLLIAVGYGV